MSMPLLSANQSWSGARSSFRLTVSTHAGLAVLSVCGDLDHQAVPELDDAIDDMLSSRVDIVIVDLTDTCFLSTGAMTALVYAEERCACAGSRYAVVAQGPGTDRLLRRVGLDEVLPLYTGLHQALDIAGNVPDGPGQKAALSTLKDQP